MKPRRKLIDIELHKGAHKTWTMMKQRCHNPKYDGYRHYGGRGIAVCDRWRYKNGFSNFLSDMGDRPDGCSIDRIDVNGNYEPGNCRWATVAEQSRNRTNNNCITYNGETHIATDWAIIYATEELSTSVIARRLNRGWNMDRAITEKARRYKIEWNGSKYFVKDLAKMYNLTQKTLEMRIYNGWAIEDALFTPGKTTGRSCKK